MLGALREAFALRSTWLGLGFALTGAAGFEAAGQLAGPFLVDRGVDNDTIGVFFGVYVVSATLLGGLLGGWLSDRYGAHSVTWWVMWVSWICLFLLSYPQTDFTILTVDGPRTFHIGLNVYMFTALLAVLGVAWAFGKASVFKYISDDYAGNIGTISGIVGLAGGLGGFILPIMFGALMDVTGIRSSAFMLMYGVVWVSLIWMYWTEVRRTDLMQPHAPAAAPQH